MEEKNIVKGYKAFNDDWTCRDFQYEVGKEYTMPESPKCCERGFHFCLKAVDCFSYYTFNPNNKVAEVEAFGDIDYHDDDSKACTNGIRIVRELTWGEVLELVNTGTGCSGMRNSGNGNSGNGNSGNGNSGNRNSGNGNSGNRNSGDWNHTNFSAGIFNTEEQKIRMFNKESDWTYRDWLNSRARYILMNVPQVVVEWIWSDDMTDEEKSKHPDYETTGGYLKVTDKRSCATDWWNGLPKSDKDEIKSLPNFDFSIFCECVGIDKERAEQ